MDQAEEPDTSTSTTTSRSRSYRRIVRLGDGNRVGKLLGLQGYTHMEQQPAPQILGTGEGGNDENDGNITLHRVLDPSQLYHSFASYLASRAFNERNGDILPGLPEILDGCDFYWDYEYRDGQQQGLETTRQLLNAVNLAYDNHDNQQQAELHDNNNSDTATTLATTYTITISNTDHEQEHQNSTKPRSAIIRQAVESLEPFAIYGAFWSSVSKTVTFVSSAFEIPYISGVSSSSELVGTPLFARTGLPSDADARAIMLYYGQLQISHVAVLYVKDSWGIPFHQTLDLLASSKRIQLQGFPYDLNPDSIHKALEDLKQSQYRHVFAILPFPDMVLPIAYDYGVVGHPDYAWMTPETKAWTADQFQLSRRNHEDDDYKLAYALHGIGTLNPYFQPNPAFEEAMSLIETDRKLQEDFISIQKTDTSIFYDTENNDLITFPTYSTGVLSPFIFDAVIALGIAACNASLPDQFTPSEFYEALKYVEFEGVSGKIVLDHETGIRLVSDELRYTVEYISISDSRSDDDFFRFDSGIAAILTGGHNFTALQPFIYNDNTTTIPPSLPPIHPNDIELNLLPIGMRVFGYALSGWVILCSMICLLWTFTNRNRVFVVRASQPIYLCQLCVGTSITAVSIIAASFPLSSSIVPGISETRNLDMACMATPWLLFLGFSIIFSALASKTWRLHQILKLGSAMRRASVSVWDGMWPLFVHLPITLTLLSLASILAPMQYERVIVPNHVDDFGRSLESYPTCKASDNLFFWLIGTLWVINTVGVAIVTWITYQGRHIAPFDFSDANNLAVSMMSILETFFLGGPLLILVKDDPAAYYMVESSLVGIACLTLLGLLFVPKYLGRHKNPRPQSVANALQARQPMAQNVTLGGGAAAAAGTQSQTGPSNNSQLLYSCDSCKTINSTSDNEVGKLKRGQMSVARIASTKIR